MMNRVRTLGGSEGPGHVLGMGMRDKEQFAEISDLQPRGVICPCMEAVTVVVIGALDSSKLTRSGTTI